MGREGETAMSLEAEPVEVTGVVVGPVVEPDGQVVTAAPRPPKPEPVKAAERVASVDVLRGVALLGILAMNIVFFGLPAAAYDNPTRGGGETGINLAVWAFNHMVFDGKMMTIFSMLFGAGLVLMGERADARGARLGWFYYRRVLWLLVLGALHAYLLWSGDILVAYAQCGLILYPFRRRSAATLLIVGTLMMSVLVPIAAGFDVALMFMQTTAARVEALPQPVVPNRVTWTTEAWALAAQAQYCQSIAPGPAPYLAALAEAVATARQKDKPTKFEAWIHEFWTETVRPNMEPSKEKQEEAFNKEVKVYQKDGYAGIVAHNAGQLLGSHTLGFVLAIIWMIGGRMLFGMGLMKMGVFSAARSRRFYVWLMIVGYGLGLPLVGYDTYALIQSHFHYAQDLRSGYFFNYFGSVLVALGHVGAVMLIYKAGLLHWLTFRLAAVGRMALTNYLMQSALCTTLFYGYGYGLYGKFERWQLACVVLAIWALQLAYSPIWLRFFRFGPAEWVWRSLTYWRLQPILRRSEPAPV
jgi:uncharacterized protein